MKSPLIDLATGPIPTRRMLSELTTRTVVEPRTYCSYSSSYLSHKNCRTCYKHYLQILNFCFGYLDFQPKLFGHFGPKCFGFFGYLGANIRIFGSCGGETFGYLGVFPKYFGFGYLHSKFGPDKIRVSGALDIQFRVA